MEQQNTKQVIKPTIQEMIDTYGNYIEGVCNESSSKWFGLVERNYAALRNSTQKDYDQESFDRLIKSIESNGFESFNMSAFMGTIERFETLPTNQHSVNHSSKIQEMLNMGFSMLDNMTSAFNCDSVGCIAGFATANCLDWNQPKWLKGDTRDFSSFFESISCNWLNIPVQVGRKIFYGEDGSVWAFTRFFEPSIYPQIKWLHGDYNDHEDMSYINCEYVDQWQEDDIDLGSICYKTASDVLRRIASGEIVFELEAPESSYDDMRVKFHSKESV